MAQKEKSLPEITVKAVLLGIILSVILAGANAYLGLFAGMTVSASIPAAVISMGILRLFKKHNILENNIVQTAASAGESLAAGVIFTIPALVIMGYWDKFSYVWVTLIAGFGGILGVLFTIPLRRSLIVEDPLQFPEGIATAEVLETGEKGGKGIKFIAWAAIAGGVFKIGSKALGLFPEVVEGARRIKGSVGYMGTNVSPALVSVGYIVGLNIAILIFLGGALNWFIAIPICAAINIIPDSEAMGATELANTIWSQQTRYIGVGAMLVGGLWAIIKMRKSLFSGILSGLKAYKKNKTSSEEIDRTEKDMPMKWVLILIVASVVPLFLIYQHFVGDIRVTIPMSILMLVTGFLFSAVAAYMAGIVGSSNNPISGITIATVVVASLLLLLLMGKNAPNGPAAAIIIGSVICCAAAIAGDNMQDLKAGHIVKATPWKQQVMQLIGTISGALVMAPILQLLYTAYGFKGVGEAKSGGLSAVQANLMASVANGVFKNTIPWTFAIIGMGVAVAIIATDIFLEKKKSSFRMPVLAVAIGIYLPLELATPIFAGGLISYAIKKFHRKAKTEKKKQENSERNCLLFASGLITGEAILGILLAVPIVILKQYDKDMPIWNLDAFTQKAFNMASTPPIGMFLGLALLGGICVWLYRIGVAKTVDE